MHPIGSYCDDFARLSYNFFGKTFVWDNEIWSFSGLYSLIYGFSGHMIAIWKNAKGEVFRVSNYTAEKVKYISEDWEKLRDKKLEYLVRFDLGKWDWIWFKDIIQV